MNVATLSVKPSEGMDSIGKAVGDFSHPSAVVFFAPARCFAAVSDTLHSCFPDSDVIGTTSCYTYGSGGLATDAVDICIFTDGIECSGGVIEEIKRYPMKYAPRVRDAVAELSSTDNAVCLAFTTARSLSEELVLATLDSACGMYSIPVFGGTAGMSAQELASGTDESYVSYNGKVYTDASVFLLIRNCGGRIMLYKENAYKPTDSCFTVTAVDVKTRRVIELDHQPAVSALCCALKCGAAELPHYLQIYPLGRAVSGDIYISDFSRIYDDGSVSWNTRIYNNTKVILLAPDDLRACAEKTFARIHGDIPSPRLTLVIHCLARTLYYEQEGYLSEYAAECARNLGTIAGFSSMGEQLGSMHLNQTMIAAVFE